MTASGVRNNNVIPAEYTSLLKGIIPSEKRIQYADQIKLYENPNILTGDVYQLFGLDINNNEPFINDVRYNFKQNFLKYGDACFKGGFYEEAYKAYNILAYVNNLSPHSMPTIMFHKGKTLYKLGDIEESKKVFNYGLQNQYDIFSALCLNILGKGMPLSKHNININPFIMNSVWNMAVNSPRAYNDKELTALDEFLKANYAKHVNSRTLYSQMIPFGLFVMKDSLLNKYLTLDQCFPLLDRLLNDHYRQFRSGDKFDKIWDGFVREAVSKSSIEENFKAELLTFKDTALPQLFLQNSTLGLLEYPYYKEFNPNFHYGMSKMKGHHDMYKVPVEHREVFSRLIFSQMIDIGNNNMPFLYSKYPFNVVGSKYEGVFRDSFNKDKGLVMAVGSSLKYSGIIYNPRIVSYPIRNEVAHYVSLSTFPAQFDNKFQFSIMELFDVMSMDKLPIDITDNTVNNELISTYNSLNNKYLLLAKYAHDNLTVDQLKSLRKEEFMKNAYQNMIWYINGAINAFGSKNDNVSSLIIGEGVFYLLSLSSHKDNDPYLKGLIDETTHLQQKLTNIPLPYRLFFEGVVNSPINDKDYSYNLNTPKHSYLKDKIDTVNITDPSDKQYVEHIDSEYLAFLIKKKIQLMILNGDFTGIDGKVSLNDVLLFYKSIPYYLALTEYAISIKENRSEFSINDFSAFIPKITKDEVFDIIDSNDSLRTSKGEPMKNEPSNLINDLYEKKKHGEDISGIMNIIDKIYASWSKKTSK